MLLDGLEFGWRWTARIRQRRRAGASTRTTTIVLATLLLLLLTASIALSLFQRLLSKKVGRRLQGRGVLALLDKLTIEFRIEQEFLTQVKMTLRTCGNILVVQEKLSRFEAEISHKSLPFLSVHEST